MIGGLKLENLNLIYNKLYYNNNEKSQSITKTIFKNEQNYKKSEVATHTFIMKTGYPGLLIGTGNPHAIGAKENDAFKVGFSFDYTTGQPYIPGSSVKGMLRSCFKNGVVGEILGINDKEKINMIEKEIFDECKDVFFDAVIYDGDSHRKILGEDYITPHKDAIKNPIPIKILKILPDVKIEFRFALQPGIIDAEEKKELFAKLLEIFGIGAKTNVGYGILQRTDDTICEKNIEATPKCQNNDKSTPKCKKCGANVKINSKTNKPYEYCYKCSNENKNYGGQNGRKYGRK